MNQKGSYEAGEQLCDKSPYVYRNVCNEVVEERREFFR